MSDIIWHLCFSPDLLHLDNNLKAHPCCCKWHSFILFHGWVIFRCVYVPRPLYPFLCSWTLRRLLCPHCCWHCCWEHRGETLNFLLNSSDWTDHIAELTVLRHLCFQPNTLSLSSQIFGKFYPSPCQQHPGSTSATPRPRCRTLPLESHLLEPLSESEILCVHFTHKESAPARWVFRSHHAEMSMHKFSFPLCNNPQRWECPPRVPLEMEAESLDHLALLRT